MSNVLVDRQKIDILANAISEKSGEPVTMTLNEMVEAVDGIDTSSGITPTGNIDITQAGVTDVTNYATATVPYARMGLTTMRDYTTVQGQRRYYVTPSCSVTSDGWVDSEYEPSPVVGTYFTAIPTGTTVTPTTSAQTIGGANYMMEGAVTVNPIPSQYIVPSGTYSITSNGIYDIVSFASVDVQVSGGGGGDHDVEDEIIDRTISVCENSRVTNIGANAFYSCKHLTTANFPNVTSIGSSAFGFCDTLATISFPKATDIGISAFIYCYALTTVNFPSVTDIGSSAFYSCIRLATISFPKAVSIKNHAFYSCKSLTTANFPSVTDIWVNAFYNCTKLVTVSFPNAASIGSSAFRGCTDLTIVSFPNAASIGSNAFRDCTSLESFYVLASSMATLGTSAFLSTPMSLSSYLGYFGSIYVPASLVDSYKSAANWSAYADRITSYTE